MKEKLYSIASFVLLLFSSKHERANFIPTIFVVFASFFCLGKDKRSISKIENNFFKIHVDYKTLQDFTRKQCQLKSRVQANTHTHTQDDRFTLASHLLVARVIMTYWKIELDNNHILCIRE